MPPDASRYPGPAWDTAPAPREVGWSPDRLQQAEHYASSIGSVAVMVVARGEALGAWGETDHAFGVRSIRKSLLSALYGVYVDAGRLDLSQSLDALGIDDRDPPLTAPEKQATVADLLTARSGVYHLANCQGQADRARMPARLSHAPGTFWYYNNWDFNALGAIFEQRARTKIFEEFDRRIARPLQMEDFDPRAGRYVGGPDSIHPGYMFHLSARDLARFGLLYLRHGRWRERQVVPRRWVADSTMARARTPDGAGYGYMWWVATEGASPLPMPLPAGAYAALGTGGQLLLVVPSRDLVVVHLTNPDDPGYRDVSPTPDHICRLLGLIFAAQENV